MAIVAISAAIKYSADRSPMQKQAPIGYPKYFRFLRKVGIARGRRLAGDVFVTNSCGS